MFSINGIWWLSSILSFLKLLNNISIKKNQFLYSKERCEKLAGNSIVVDVLMAIFKQVDDINRNILNSKHKKGVEDDEKGR